VILYLLINGDYVSQIVPWTTPFIATGGIFATMTYVTTFIKFQLSNDT